MIIPDHFPLVGTPRHLAGIADFHTFADAVNDGLGLPRTTAIVTPIEPTVASNVIEYLLPLAVAKGYAPSARAQRRTARFQRSTAERLLARRGATDLAGVDTEHSAPNWRAGARVGPMLSSIDVRAHKLIADVLDRGFPASLAVSQPDVVGTA